MLQIDNHASSDKNTNGYHWHESFNISEEIVFNEGPDI